MCTSTLGAYSWHVCSVSVVWLNVFRSVMLWLGAGAHLHTQNRASKKILMRWSQNYKDWLTVCQSRSYAVETNSNMTSAWRWRCGKTQRSVLWAGFITQVFITALCIEAAAVSRSSTRGHMRQLSVTASLLPEAPVWSRGHTHRHKKKWCSNTI